MKNLGYYNGKYDEIEKMQIPMLDRVCWFGDGVYDATYAHNHVVFDMDAHLTRFYNSAKLLGMNIPMERDELEKLLRELVLKVDDGDQFVYMQVTRGSGLRGHIYAEDIKANLWITLTPCPVADTYKPIDVKFGDGVKYIFEGGNWVHIRFSGTENLLRYHVEFTTEIECERNTKAILNFVNDINNNKKIK